MYCELHPTENTASGRASVPKPHQIQLHQALICALLVCCLLSFAPFAQSGQEGASQAEFELQVGDNMSDVTLGKPTAITTPGGERVELVLRRKEVLRYSGDGIAFSYHHEMTLSADKGHGATTITLECPQSPLVLIQAYSPGAFTAAELRSTLMQSFRDEFKSRNADFLEGSGRSVTRKISGEDREGRVLEFLIAGQRTKTEIYVFPKGDMQRAIILQNDTDDEELANKYFPIITDSLK